MQFFGRNPSGGQSLASPSSKQPTPVAGPPSNDHAASIMSTLSKPFKYHRWKHGRTDTTGAIAATSSNNNGPLLQSNKSLTASSPSLADTPNTQTKDPPDNDVASGNKTANATVILGIVQTICEVLDKVPYVKAVTGVATTAIKIINEVDACKREWDNVKDALRKVCDVVHKFRYGRDDLAPLPDDVKAAFRELETCLLGVLEAARRFEVMSPGELTLKRIGLKEEATSSVIRIDRACQVFQMNHQVGIRLAVEKVLAVVLSMPQGSIPSSPLKLDVLACPTPSQYFTGRESILRQLSRTFSAPVVTLFSANGGELAAFVRSFSHSSRFTPIFLDASSVGRLRTCINALNIKADDEARLPSLLVLENVDPSIELDQYLTYSLHHPILMASTDHAVSRFASPAYALELPNATNSVVENALSPLLRVVTLVAKGGTGKTQVVLKLVSENPTRFSHVWLVDATSDATLTADFKKLGKVAGVGETVNDVRAFLGRIREDWLLIFDSADNPQVDLSIYIPQCNHGNVIITSRLTEVKQMASPGCHLDFSDLEQWEAISLVLKRANQVDSDTNRRLASDIVDALGCQALAVATAGAYIASSATCILDNYLSLFERKRKELLNYKMRSLDGYQKTVFSAFQLSFDQLSPPTKVLSQICAFFHRAAIPVEVFRRAAAFTGKDALPGEEVPGVEELERILLLFADNWSWDDSVDQLVHFSLATYDDNAKSLSFHSILHSCARETVDDKDEFRHLAQLLLARATPEGRSNADYQLRWRLIAHADYVHQNDLSAGLICTRLAMILFDGGLWAKAEGLRQEAVRRHKRYLGDHHPDTLASMGYLAMTFRSCGRLEEGEALEEEVLKIRKEVLGEHHPDTLSSMGNLSLAYRKRGQLKEAEALGEEVLKLHREVLGEHHPNTLTSMGNLAVTYLRCGRLEEAEALQEEVLKVFREVLEEHHPDTLSIMDNLAVTYQQHGRLEEAEALEKELLKIHRQVLGECHPNTLSTMGNLAVTYIQCGRLEEAEALGEEVLKARRQVLGECHPDTLSSMGNLASMYHQHGRLEEAEALGEEVLKIFRKVLGERHPDTLTSMGNLALMYHHCGRLEEAEALEEEVLKINWKLLDERHTNILKSMAELARMYHQHGQLEEIDAVGNEMFKMYRQAFLEGNPDILTSMGNLAFTYCQRGRLEDAKVLQELVLKLHRQVLGEHHPDTLTSMGDLAMTYNQCGQLEEAEALQEEVLKIRRQVLGECHPIHGQPCNDVSSV